MSTLDARAGRLLCACPAGAAPLTRGAFVTLAAGFGLGVLAQALILSILPEAGRLLAPSPAGIGWPLAALLIGAASASFPAAFLIDSFGRRAALALGAGLGAAGGLLAGFALTHDKFSLLCLAAFWLGAAQGFALFYRHLAAQGGAAAAFSGGAAAGLAAPAAAAIIESFGGGAGATALVAALLQIAALAVSSRLPHALAEAEAATPVWPRRFGLATGCAAFAWFAMAATMLHGPLALAACRAGPAFVGGAMAWHLVAMFAPAAAAARWPQVATPGVAIGAGFLLLAGAAAALLPGVPAIAVALAMLAAGAGWSLVNLGALRLLHDGPPPPRTALAAHDLVLLAAAAMGAVVV